MRLPKTAGRLGALLFAAILATLAVLARNWKESDAAAALPPSPTGLWQSSLVTEPISGFGGPTPVNIALDPDSGAIRSIEFLPNAEDHWYNGDWLGVLNPVPGVPSMEKGLDNRESIVYDKANSSNKPLKRR